MDNEAGREKYQDRHDDLDDEQTELNGLSEERHIERTRAEYRDENGEEMDEFDGNNMSQAASYEALDEFDADLASEIDQDLHSLRPRIDGITDLTSVAEMATIGRSLDEVADKINQRRRHLES